jgi:hypothetical protein
VTNRHQPLPAAPGSPARPARARRTLIAPGATAEEAAAIVAAIERFIDDTTPAAAPRPPTPGRWLRAALLEGVSRADRRRGAWGDPHR